MNKMIWFETKDKSRNSSKVISDTEQIHLKIPLTYICTSPNQIRQVNNEDLKITSSKIQFNYFQHPDTPQPECIEISCKTIQKLQYNDRKDILRIVLRADIYIKYFYHKEEDDDLFKDSIWFCLQIAGHKPIINTLINNLIPTFPISQIPHNIQKQFELLLCKISDKTNSNNLIKSNSYFLLGNSKLCSNSNNLQILPSLKGNQVLSSSQDNDLDKECPDVGKELVKVRKKLKRYPSTSLEILDKKPKIITPSSHKLLYSPTPSHSIEISESDLNCLIDGKYLNDNIVNWYLTYIYFEKLSQSQRDKTYFFNIFFNTKLIGTFAQQKIDSPATRHARVAKWTKKVDIFSKDFIVIPVIEDRHWFFVIICFPWMAGMVDYSILLNKSSSNSSPIPVNLTEFATVTRFNRREELQKEQHVNPKPCILIFDSLDYPKKYTKVNIIREYLKSEWNAKRSETDGSLIFEKNTCRGYNPLVLKQSNGTDCGLYLLQYVESFFENSLTNYGIDVFKRGFIHWFNNSLINRKRKEMRDIILSKSKILLPIVEENDDEDPVYCFNIL